MSPGAPQSGTGKLRRRALYLGHDFVGQAYIGHNYVGQAYIGHDYVGQAYTGLPGVMEYAVTPGSRRASSCAWRMSSDLVTP